MVEINNQRKAFLDMLAWSEELITDIKENQKSWLWRHCRRRKLFTDYSITLANLSRYWNSNQQAPDATSFFPVGGMPTISNGLKDFSKSQDAVALRTPMIDRGDIRQAIDRCSNIWASLPGAGYGQFEHKLTTWCKKFKEAGGTVREIDVWARLPLSRSGYLHHRLPVMGC